MSSWTTGTNGPWPADDGPSHRAARRQHRKGVTTTGGRTRGGALRAIYRGVWTVVAALTYGVGLIGVLIGIPWQAAVSCFLVAGLLGGSFVLSLEDDPSRPIRPGRPVIAGMFTGFAVLAALGLAVLFGPPGAVLLITVHLFQPRLWMRLASLRARSRRQAQGGDGGSWSTAELDADTEPHLVPGQPPARQARSSCETSKSLGVSASYMDAWSASRAGSPPAAPEPIDDPTPLDVPDQLTDEDLCLAWQSSILGLQHSRSVAARIRVVEARQACLDELERRHPKALHAWLESGARAASTPTKYLTGQARRNPFRVRRSL